MRSHRTSLFEKMPLIAELAAGDALAAQVAKDGWVSCRIENPNCSLNEVVEAVGRRLGTPLSTRARQCVESLSPKTRSDAHANSLSTVHGLGLLPLHTDGSHLLQPPRYVILMCASRGSWPTPTRLLRFRDLGFTAAERARFAAAPFLVRNGRRSFYSTIYAEHRPFIRFDQGCMMPQTPDSAASLAIFTARANDADGTLIDWRVGDAIIIDNWNVLHGRGMGNADAARDRMLLRVSVR